MEAICPIIRNPSVSKFNGNSFLIYGRGAEDIYLT